MTRTPRRRCPSVARRKEDLLHRPSQWQPRRLRRQCRRQRADQATRDRSADVGATWSPDGKHIAFTSERDGSSQIYVSVGVTDLARREICADRSATWPPLTAPHGPPSVETEAVSTGLDHPRRAAGVPPAGEADGRGLQPRLLVLLLPLEGDALSGLALPDGRRAARGLRAAADRGARERARGDGRLAGRRADDDGRRVLPPLGRAREPVPEARPEGRLHDPDQRHAARRGVGRVLQGARVPGRDLDRRHARAARHLPRQQGRPRLVRPGDPRPRPPEGRGCRVERAHDRARRERRPRPRGLPLPARRVRRAVRPVHPHHRARRRGRRRRRGALELLARPAALRAAGRPRHRPLDHRRAVRPLPDRRVRGVGAPRRRRGLRADVRRRPRQLGRRAARPLRPPGDLRARARARAHRRPLLLRPLRRARLQARQHQARRRCSSSSPRSSRSSSGSTSATRCRLLPGVRRALRLPRRLPQGPLHLDARRRAGPQLPLRRLQGLLPPRRRADADDEPSARPEPRAVRDRAALRLRRTPKRGRNDPCTCGSGRNGSTATAPDGASPLEA